MRSQPHHSGASLWPFDPVPALDARVAASEGGRARRKGERGAWAARGAGAGCRWLSGHAWHPVGAAATHMCATNETGARPTPNITPRDMCNYRAVTYGRKRNPTAAGRRLYVHRTGAVLLRLRFDKRGL